MLLALKKNGARPRDRDRSVERAGLGGRRRDPVNAQWWSFPVDHEAAYKAFRARLLVKHGLDPFCEVVRLPSDDVKIDGVLDLAHIDGSHTLLAFRDVQHFAPLCIRTGGILVMDDIGWVGGGVDKGVELALDDGLRRDLPALERRRPTRMPRHAARPGHRVSDVQ